LKKEYAHVPEGAQIAAEGDFGANFDFGMPADDQTVHFGAPDPARGGAANPAAPALPGDMPDFAAGGFGAAPPGGFRDTTEGPVFDLGLSPDEAPEAKPRQVVDLSDAGAAPASPANPVADTRCR